MAKIALLIGVSEYEPGLNSLPAAIKDVEAMQRVLRHPEMGNFAESDVKVLKNPERQEMEEEIQALFDDRHKDDLVRFSFLGTASKIVMAEPQLIYDQNQLVAAVVKADMFQAFLAWQQQSQKASLASAFAELRELCAEENYVLEAPPRQDGSNPFAESPHDLPL
jgi:hypothetical protein